MVFDWIENAALRRQREEQHAEFLIKQQEQLEVEWGWILNPATNWEVLSTPYLLRQLQILRLAEGNLNDHWDKLKEVLATRPHVPNKEDGKKLRRAKQTKKQKRVLTHGR